MGTREDILRCARDLYVRDGLPGLSLRVVARCAKVSPAAIYRHFEDKEALLLEVALEGHEIFGRYLARGLRGATPRDRLVQTGVGYLDFALEHRPHYLVMFVAPPEHLGFDRLAEKNDAEGSATFRMLIDRVRECMEERVLAEEDPIAVSLTIWAHVHGLVSLFYRVPEDPGVAALAPAPVATEAKFRAFYARSLDALLRGLAPER